MVVLALILELDRQRGRQVSKFKASRAYRTSSKTAKTTQRNPVSGKKSLAVHEIGQGVCIHIKDINSWNNFRVQKRSNGKQREARHGRAVLEKYSVRQQSRTALGKYRGHSKRLLLYFKTFGKRKTNATYYQEVEVWRQLSLFIQHILLSSIAKHFFKCNVYKPKLDIVFVLGIRFLCRKIEGGER